MLNLEVAEGPKPTCMVTTTQLPKFLDREQPPTKKRPFSTVLGQTFSHNLTLLLPSTAATNFQPPPVLTYAKVHMRLLEILSGEFFATYVKTPSSSEVQLISIDAEHGHTFTLTSGILRLEIDRPTFEKLGLQGKAIPSEGRKHIKAWYLVELNLRLPSMVRGKPGFERLIWACKNVLDYAVTWLVCSSGDFDREGPIREFQPAWKDVQAETIELQNAILPSKLLDKDRVLLAEDFEEASELLEWISLATLGSERICKDDKIDTYLSRYRVPTNEEIETQDIVSMRWKGLVSPNFAHKMLLVAIRAAADQWLVLTATSFDGEAYTILIQNGRAVTWECKD